LAKLQRTGIDRRFPRPAKIGASQGLQQGLAMMAMNA
jgi:hypothetical protein